MAKSTSPTDCELEIISLGDTPAAICRCGAWGWATTRGPSDTMQTVTHRIEEAWREHLAEKENGQSNHQTP